MAETKCPKCGAASSRSINGNEFFQCGTFLSWSGLDERQSDRCRLNVAERERDEVVMRIKEAKDYIHKLREVERIHGFPLNRILAKLDVEKKT